MCYNTIDAIIHIYTRNYTYLFFPRLQTDRNKSVYRGICQTSDIHLAIKIQSMNNGIFSKTWKCQNIPNNILPLIY